MKIGILGTGAYGMALLKVCKDNKLDVKMWTNSKEERDLLIKEGRSNKVNYVIPKDIVISIDMEEVVKDSDVILIAVPSIFVGTTSLEIKKYYSNQVIGIASKGMDNGLFLYDVIKNSLNTKNIVVISGCTFAEDMVKNIPLGINISSYDKKSMDVMDKVLSSKYLKVKKSNDVIGIELCGILKNIYAIGCGMLEGMEYPESTKAMYLTDVMMESMEFIKIMGGSKNTILSYAGVGDLILTSLSSKSRNYTLGKMIGSNVSKEEINKYIDNNVVEGFVNIKNIKRIMEWNNYDMKIINYIDKKIKSKLN